MLAYAATRLDGFRISRSIGIAAPPERILPLIEDFLEWKNELDEILPGEAGV